MLLYRKTVAVAYLTLMTVMKLASLANGRCTTDAIVQSTNTTFWRKLQDQTICVPSCVKDPVGFRFVVTAETLATLIAYPYLTHQYLAPSISFWLFADWYLSLPETQPSSPRKSPQQVRRDLCHLQNRLLPRHQPTEPPTLFEFLGLDASRHPFFPPNESASPANRYHEDAIRAIQDAAIDQYIEAKLATHGWLAEEAKKARLIGSVATMLLDDMARYEYMVLFMPVLAGRRLDIGVGDARGRRKALAGICDGLEWA